MKNNENQAGITGCGAAAHEEICDGALKHYEELATECSNWYSVVPQAIKFYRKYGHEKEEDSRMDDRVSAGYSNAYKKKGDVKVEITPYPFYATEGLKSQDSPPPEPKPANQNEESQEKDDIVPCANNDYNMLRLDMMKYRVGRAKESKMNDAKEEVVQMGGPVLMATVYDSIVGRIQDTNQEIRTELSDLSQKVVFISCDLPSPARPGEEQVAQNFPDTDLSNSLKNLLSQSEEILVRLRSITSGIVS